MLRPKLAEVIGNRKQRDLRHDVLVTKAKPARKLDRLFEVVLDLRPGVFDFLQIRPVEVLNLVLDRQPLGEIQAAFQNKVFAEGIAVPDGVEVIGE